MIEAAGTIVAGSVYAGIDSVANLHLNRTTIPRRITTPVVRALLTWRPMPYRITVDGTPHEERGYAVVAASSGFYGNPRHMAPNARTDDGLLDIVIFRHAHRAGVRLRGDEGRSRRAPM